MKGQHEAICRESSCSLPGVVLATIPPKREDGGLNLADSAFELLVHRRGAETRKIRLPGEGDISIGKDPSCTLVLDDDKVSRLHATLRAQGGFFVLEDRSSFNGTRVNGTQIHTHFLNPGDEIEIGDSSLLFQKAGSPAPAQKSELARERGAGAYKNVLDVLSTLLSRKVGESEVFERMLDGLLTAFDADRGVVFLPGKLAGEFVVKSTRFRGGAAKDQEPISQTLIKQVAKDGKPQLLTNLETEELKKQIGSISCKVRSIVAAPLPLVSGPGVVYLDSALETRKFEDGDKELLLAFANAAGNAFKVSEATERMAEIQRREVAGQQLLGQSPAMKAVMGEVSKAAATDVTVLVVGETGTGKELVARALHRGSPRRRGPFVAVNCAAIPSELVESELFGHEKGAFSGADAKRLGRFELADSGTLFLDEVGELPMAAQGKLLRALQERVIERVGSGIPIPVDFRLVCATNVDLGNAVKDGRFREDLYYRIAVFPLALPPLRDRGDDVCLIAEEFLQKYAHDFRRNIRGLDDEARKALRSYPWPGNIRELRNVIEQAVVRCDGDMLSAQTLLPAMGRLSSFGSSGLHAAGAAAAAAGGGGGGGTPIDRYPPRFDDARKQFEKEFLTHKLGVNKGNIKATAEAVGLTRRALYLKCEEYGIDYTQYR